MTPAELNKLINIYCFGSAAASGDVEFPLADKLILINAFKDVFAAKIAKRNEDYFGMVFTDDLVAGQRTYPLPDDILNSKGFEAKLDGVNFQWLREFDLNSMKKPTSEADIIANFSGYAPMIDIFDRAITIYSGTAIADVAGGLKYWGIIYPANITDLTSAVDMSINPTPTAHGFPRQFHELLARRVAIAWKTGQDRPKTLNEKELVFNSDFESALNDITGGNLDRSHTSTMSSNTGENY
ncbi:MAG: hypothetical protein ACD_5C00016G0004 [uncultured bacterium]|nr:MAG: hypothetical protein ACD_5C00016G0004 [uncultured bacterium]